MSVKRETPRNAQRLGQALPRATPKPNRGSIFLSLSRSRANSAPRNSSSSDLDRPSYKESRDREAVSASSPEASTLVLPIKGTSLRVRCKSLPI
eukprot:1409729-Amphidinium_carterae.2